MLTSHTNDAHQVTLEVGIGGTLADKLTAFENGAGSYEIVDSADTATVLRLSGKNDSPHYLVFFPSIPSVEVIAREVCRTCNDHTLIYRTYKRNDASARVLGLVQWITECIGDDVLDYSNI